MLANTITLADINGDHDFDLTFRSGYDSIRRETAAESALAHQLVVKNTIDIGSPSKLNRHLVQLSKNVEDPVTGEFKPVSVHFVVTRHKDVADQVIFDMAEQLSGMLSVDTYLAQILLGAS